MARQILRRKRRIKKVGPCYFCKQKKLPDYKDTETLRHFITERGKIVGRQDSGVCQKHQRLLGSAIKQARFLSLIPFVVRPS